MPNQISPYESLQFYLTFKPKKLFITIKLMLSPIVLFTYNRLESCKKTIESLKLNHLSKESNLYIFSDGPKTSRDHFEIADLRKYLRQIKGFKSINISKSEENKGLAKSVISGVSQVFQKYENIIVIEDDLVFSRNFLDFMNQALSYYKRIIKYLVYLDIH